jgi:hypothetical protein
MPKRRKADSGPQIPLDTVFEKRGRGRRGVRASEITGRSHNYRTIFGYLWDGLRVPLSEAKDEADVIKAFDEKAQPYMREFMPMLAGLVLKVIREPKFPKRRDAQINFLADSLAGYGTISPRRSRDICDQERARERAKSKYKIIRKEFYIECSCGYKGPARDNACRKCGAEISIWSETMWGNPNLFR